MNYKDFLADADRDCAIVAHRGIWRDAPENSLKAVSQAIDDGFDVVEIDVRRSADGGFFLLHDETLLRMTGVDSPLERLDGLQLSKLRLRDRDGGPLNALTDQTLPRLEDLFALTRGRIFVHLDVKDHALIPEVMAAAKAAGVLDEIDVWHPLRHGDDLAFIRSAILREEVALVAKTRIDGTDAAAQAELVLALKPAVCEIYFDDLAQIAPLRDRFATAGITLWVNTLDDVSCAGLTDTAALQTPEAVWGALLDAGISAIQTDEAAALRTFIQNRKHHTP